MATDVYNAIKSEYDKKQLKANSDLEARKKQVYSRVPGLVEVVNEINACGLKYNKMILFGTGGPQSLAGDLSARIDKLKDKKSRLLNSAGYPSNYLEPVYECNLCNDTGYVESEGHTEKCICYRQKLLNHLYSQSNLKLAETENFTSFDQGFYSGAVDYNRYGIDVSPRENVLNIREHCLGFIQNFSSPDEKNLFFSGPTGVGKTFMANCIAMELMKKGFTVLYQTAPRLFDAIGEYKMKAFKDDGYHDETYKNILEADLLIIDDLGTESPSAARYAELLTILNTRQINNLSKPCKTIISTNIGVKKLHDYYDERVVSRIIGCFDLFKFAGDDIRGIKISNRK